jgi:hypothetical protein
MQEVAVHRKHILLMRRVIVGSDDGLDIRFGGKPRDYAGHRIPMNAHIGIDKENDIAHRLAGS